MKISLLLPTTGRPALLRALRSLERQAWLPGDEVMVISDGNHQEVDRLLAEAGHFQHSLPLRRVCIADGPHKDWGHTPRNRCMKMALGDYVCHFDDDDVALPGMVESMRAPLAQAGVHLFRMVIFKSKKLIWDREGLLKRRHISTQNIVHPNSPSTFGTWGSFYGGDSQFIIQTAKHFPGKVFWHDVMTCVYGPPPEMSLVEVCDWYAGLKAE